ncbi:hypothetical protein BMS3Bbin12_00553 [bacterium BMS3Bbin12]|nr:hypothetical protein BMS3Abin12_00706 [bacterium BMS3Abin12]GBE47393.1 hypothetical protein BMS3Bbin12_00553 [bacterium BMS3Bbin12]
MFPEAPANGQQRIVLDQDRLVLTAGADLGAHQVTVEFPGVGFQRRFDVVDAVRTLCQNDPPDNRFDIVVREFDIDREPALETLKRRRAGERGLPGSQEEQAIAKPFAACLNDLLNHIGTAGIVADVLLYFVENDDGARHIAVGRQCILQRTGEFVRGDVLGLGKLGPQRGPGILLAAGEVRVSREQRLGDQRADIQIVQLAPEFPALRLDHGAHLVIDVVLFQPEAEARLGKTLGQFRGLEHDSEKREPNAVTGAGAEISRCGMQSMTPLTEGRDFF